MNEDTENRFAHHAKSAEQISHQRDVRDECRRLAQVLSDLPSGRERALAITKVEEAMFWANAAIARCK